MAGHEGESDGPTPAVGFICSKQIVGHYKSRREALHGTQSCGDEQSAISFQVFLRLFRLNGAGSLVHLDQGFCIRSYSRSEEKGRVWWPRVCSPYEEK